MIRTIRVNVLGDRLLLVPYDETDGPHVMSEAITEVRASAPAAERGCEIRAALARCREGVDSGPTAGSEAGRKFLKLAGARSWRAVERAWLLCGVTSVGSFLELQPERRRPRGGYLPIPGTEIRLPESVPDQELGEALDRALALCE